MLLSLNIINIIKARVNNFIEIAIRLILFLILMHMVTIAQIPEPPCGLTYGTEMDRIKIQQAMFTGSKEEVESTINNAKNSRGLYVGCPEKEYGPFVKADSTAPTLEAVLETWQDYFIPNIDMKINDCPLRGRDAAVSLGAYYANLGGYFDNLEALEQMALNLMATQYSAKVAPIPLSTSPGMYSPIVAKEDDPCEFAGSMGEALRRSCFEMPGNCIVYNSGLFSGHKFLVNDHVVIGDITDFDEIIGDIGGGGYDHGWAGVFMLESAIQFKDTMMGDQFLESAVLAGEWAAQHPLVTNHNYTSKLIWLLAQLYTYTARADFKEALLEKLDRNLIPGILIDLNNDGFVDDMADSTKFEELTFVAQVPGRMWDGHNSLPWYHSMNAWALTEAYIAFRDMGDKELAEKYRPYMIAMLDNLSREVLQLGMPPYPAGAFWRPLPLSILNAIWKVAQFESEEHHSWYNAAWAFWNNGSFGSSFGSHGINIALLLLIVSNTSYTPLNERDGTTSVGSNSLSKKFSLSQNYPNPFNPTTTIKFVVPSNAKSEKYNTKLMVFDTLGREVATLINKKLEPGNYEVEFNGSGLTSGVYLYRLQTGSFVKTNKMVLLR